MQIMDILEDAKKRLVKDFYSPVDEWKYLNALVAQAEEQRLAVYQWVFAESPAYWDTRARAGKVLLQEDETAAWTILERLVYSTDPDDNGTALTLFEELDDSRGMQLARHWLTEDVHPITQLEAADYLRGIYPEQASQCLHRLLKHWQENIRHRAHELLIQFNK